MMKLTEYKKLSKKYSVLPLPKEVCETPEYYAFQDAFYDNPEIQEWVIKQALKEHRINYKNYCCLKMASAMIEDKREKQMLKKDPEYINYDAVMTYNKEHQEYGIPIHDGGSSWITIKYCPWCGRDLSEYKY